MIYTTDIEKSIKFYRDILELEINEFYPNEETPTWVSLRIGNGCFGIGKTFPDSCNKRWRQTS